LEELLSHTYTSLDNVDYDTFKKKIKSKDNIGNNLLHSVCELPERARERFFKILNNYPVKMLNKHSTKMVGGFCGFCR